MRVVSTAWLRRLARTVLALACLAWSTFAAPHAHAAPDDAPSTRGFQEGRILVRWHTPPNRAPGDVNLLATPLPEGVKVLHTLGADRLWAVASIPEGSDPETVAAALRASGRVAWAEPDYLQFPRGIPNDPEFPRQWGLNNTGQLSGVPDADIDAPEGWDERRDAPAIVVGVVDTGIRLSHQDLAANLWVNPGEIPGNGVDDDGNGYVDDVHGINAITGSGNPNDDDGHGTHVAGTIGAVGNNGIGVTGVAWNVRLMALKFLPPGRQGGSTSDAIECIDYAVARGVRVLNNSWGGGGYSVALLEAIQRARAAGVVFVVAAGNDAQDNDATTDYPSGYPVDNILAVGATTRLNDLATFSNFGSGSVEILAPGSEILSTYAGGDADYRELSGTSMASPHVAGVVALLRAQFPGETYRQTLNRALRSAEPEARFAGRAQTAGLVNLPRALATATGSPFNDDLARAAPLAGSRLNVRSSIAHATSEPGEPPVLATPLVQTVWFRWTAATSGQVTLDTAGSAYDTLLAVYTGAGFGDLTLVQANDNAPGSSTSRVTFNAVAGTSYAIVVGARNVPPNGLTLLGLQTVPANDAQAAPEDVHGFSWVVRGDNALATAEPGEIAHGGPSASRSLWYRWVAPKTGRVSVSTHAPSVDTTLAVYEVAGAGLNPLASNRRANPGGIPAVYGSLTAFDAVAGTEYRIVVDAQPIAGGAHGGPFTLSLVDAAWTVPMRTSMTGSPAVAPDGTVYIPANTVSGSAFTGILQAHDPEGALLWSFAMGYLDIASPTVGPDGTVYIGSRDGFLYAIRPNGTQRWRFTAATEISASPALNASGDTVYVRSGATSAPASSNRLYAVNTANGAQRWSVQLGDDSYASPVVGADGTVYVAQASTATAPGGVRAFSPSGAQLWVYSFGGDNGAYGTPAIGADGTVYIGTMSGAFHAIRPEGTVRWVYQADGSITTSPALAPDGTGYFGTYGRQIHAVRPDGTVRWTYLAGDEMRASGVAVGADGSVFLGTYDRRVVALTPEGVLRRFYAAGDWVRSMPVLADGRLYYGSNDGRFHAVPVGTGAAASAWPLVRRDAQRTGRARAADQAPAEVPARLSNLSVRVRAGSGEETVIPGVVLSGAGETDVLMRAAGPALDGFGVDGWLADPRLELRAGATLLEANAGWGSASNAGVLADAAARLGAFAFAPGSADAALYRRLAAGAYTMPTASLTGAAGVVLMEVYVDAPVDGPVPAVNLSARGPVGTGEDVMILGFVVEGGPVRVLVRGVGPGLRDFGIAGVLARPSLRVVAGGVPLHVNSGWRGSPRFAEIVTVAQRVGAFPLSDASADAVLLEWFQPGAYTVQLSGVDGDTGIGLVELYRVP